MDTVPPGRSTGREVVERTIEAALGSVPMVGAALSVTFVTALGWRLERRREEWFTRLAEGLEDVRHRIDDFDFETLADNPVFVDAVVSATRTIEHTHREGKIEALRNAVLNSVLPGAPDADVQAVFLVIADRLTASHMRLLTLLDDPPAWFARHGYPSPPAGVPGSRVRTVEAGLPELRGQQEFYLLLATDLSAAGLMTANLTGNVPHAEMMSKLTTGFGRQFVRFISEPSAD